MSEFARIEEAVLRLDEALKSLRDGLPTIKSEIDAASATKSKLERTTQMLMEAEATLSDTAKSLEGIESAVLAAMSTARDITHDPSLGLDTRMQMLKLCQAVFSSFDSAGFKIHIPEIGSDVNPEIHTVKGKAKSSLGKNSIADVISWGYQFPSKSGQLAEVLVGDGTLGEEPAPTAKAKPESKSGIAMVLDDPPEPSPKRTKKPSGSIFDQLAEAAERNREP
jgi:uncharacterized membrane protein YdfJ with MMPL/SSD domain